MFYFITAVMVVILIYVFNKFILLVLLYQNCDEKLKYGWYGFIGLYSYSNLFKI